MEGETAFTDLLKFQTGLVMNWVILCLAWKELTLLDHLCQHNKEGFCYALLNSDGSWAILSYVVANLILSECRTQIHDSVTVASSYWNYNENNKYKGFIFWFG